MSNARLFAAITAISVLGCSSESLTAGITEPIRVSYGNARNAQFLSGDLPGTPALTDEEVLNGVAPNPPTASLNVSLGTVRQAETGFVASGATSSEATAIGIRLMDLGTGYWVFPVTGLDPTKPGTYNWNATLDFGGNIEPGKHPLGVVALDSAGRGGSQVETSLCVLSDIPDNASACSATAKPPFSVLSLDWDTPVDLDLRVVTPQGKIVDPKHPSTAVAVDGKYDPTAPHTGVFDTDAERNCVHTGYRRENLVWQDPPVSGTYLVYVSLFDACGQSAVRFNLSVNRPGPAGDGGTHPLEASYSQAGELLAVDADAGAKLGLFVTEFSVQ
ncbi:MAG TPA: hypothetical protein VER11_12140 [Polyangiaceae bacterium]|nr:hypothetical protein [Polyangiaceae bacterium]